MLRYNQYLWESTEEIRDEVIYQIVQRDIMEAIKKTSEISVTGMAAWAKISVLKIPVLSGSGIS